MDSATARGVIESLRMGLPPSGHVRGFTVGRDSEIRKLERRLAAGDGGALLLKANYGAGKSHLLKFVREAALELGYAVSSVTVEAKNAVRFNRMDQVMGAVWRGLEIPNPRGSIGVRPFLDLMEQAQNDARAKPANGGFWHDLTNNWRWDYSQALESPALFVAVRAWCCDVQFARDLIDDWLKVPWVYYVRRKDLYETLVGDLRGRFLDPRRDWKFYNDGVFVFNAQGHSQSWACLRDMHRLAQNAGLRGLVILFDEFEDVITNLTNVRYQEDAFWNLFEFFAGKSFTGLTHFAVTPDFAEKCKKLLMAKERWHYDYSRFGKLPTFAMSPLELDDLLTLADRIAVVHGTGYDWKPAEHISRAEFRRLISPVVKTAMADVNRQVIKAIVAALDDAYDELE